jgi:hypothetical protein
MNGYGKRKRCAERDARIVDLAAALGAIRQLIQPACKCYRWYFLPTTKRLKGTQLPGAFKVIRHSISRPDGMRVWLYLRWFCCALGTLLSY